MKLAQMIVFTTTTTPQMKNNKQHYLREGLESMDLHRLVHTELHIDEFKSKMGNDESIAVISFKVGGKQPAQDLVNFIEKGYDWVLDADTSSGEMEDGDYIVFIEVERTPRIASYIIEMLTDLVNLTGIDVDSYRVHYHKETKEHQCSLETLRKIIPGTPEKYIKKVSKDTNELDKLKSAAGVKVTTQAEKNDYTESLRIAAGIL
jgi:hypothetical protein